MTFFLSYLAIGVLFQCYVSRAGVVQTSWDPVRRTKQDIIVNPPGGGGGGGIVVSPSTTPVDIIVNPPGAVTTTTSGIVVRGLAPGSTVQMFPGDTATVFSTNFGVANYYNNEAYSWRFEANQCTLSADCPCVDIPRSWECLGSYLKISTDYVLQNQRFCGGNKPGQPVYSETDFLGIKFRSDGKATGTGFRCVVRCEGPNMSIPAQTGVTCPTRVTTG